VSFDGADCAVDFVEHILAMGRAEQLVVFDRLEIGTTVLAIPDDA
jgi:hypothetical protein